MSTLLPGIPKVLITLLPEQRSLGTFPNLSWDDVLNVLRSFQVELVSAIPEPDLAHGYRALAAELADRIESHPNRSKGWV